MYPYQRSARCELFGHKGRLDTDTCERCGYGGLLAYTHPDGVPFRYDRWRYRIRRAWCWPARKLNVTREGELLTFRVGLRAYLGAWVKP